jgi:hypothetical protein
MDTASQYDLANLIGEHWGVVIEAYRHGLASGFGASTGPSIPGLAAVGILDSQWNKLGADAPLRVVCEFVTVTTGNKARGAVWPRWQPVKK